MATNYRQSHAPFNLYDFFFQHSSCLRWTTCIHDYHVEVCLLNTDVRISTANCTQMEVYSSSECSTGHNNHRRACCQLFQDGVFFPWTNLQVTVKEKHDSAHKFTTCKVAVEINHHLLSSNRIFSELVPHAVFNEPFSITHTFIACRDNV